MEAGGGAVAFRWKPFVALVNTGSAPNKSLTREGELGEKETFSGTGGTDPKQHQAA